MALPGFDVQKQLLLQSAKVLVVGTAETGEAVVTVTTVPEASRVAPAA